MRTDGFSRRRFFLLLAGTASALAANAGRLAAALAPPRAGEHPAPRPGIDGSNVLEGDRVPQELTELYDAVRRIPHIVDGIRCHCGCAEIDGFYSLLSCYESSGMALYCDVCRDAGRLVTRLHGEGRTLDEIRAAIDRRFA